MKKGIKKTPPSPKKRKRRTSNLLLAIIVILVIALGVLVLAQQGVFSGLQSPEQQTFTLRDQCSVFVGKLIHTINNEGECSQQCISRCDTQYMAYETSQFSVIENDCNACTCTCT